jgi:hypothetical protein
MGATSKEVTMDGINAAIGQAAIAGLAGVVAVLLVVGVLLVAASRR